MMKRSTSILLLAFVPFLTSSSVFHHNPDEPVVEDDPSAAYNATGQSAMFHRRPSTKSGGHGARLALINARFSRRPRRKHTDPEHLLEMLGHYYDPQWMSIEEPSNKDSAPDVNYAIQTDSVQFEELAKHLQELNLSQEFSEEGSEYFSRDPQSLAVVERWLLRKATCPVVYAWEDVGAMFWPRWIKRGECLNKRGTCSWPPGMYCVPSGTSTLHVLRWQCRLPKGKGRKRPHKQNPKKDWKKPVDTNHINLKCQWIRVPYPVTNECYCTC